MRFITTGRLRALEAARDGARERTVEVQERFDVAFAGHTRSVLELTARAEAAEASGAVLRAELDDAHASLAALAADHAAELEALHDQYRALYVLLHFGRVHSLYLNAESAEKAAEKNGACPGGWATGRVGLADAEVPWRWVRFDVEEGRS